MSRLLEVSIDSRFKPPLLFYLGPFITMADRFSIAPMLIPIGVSLHVPFSAAAGAATWYFLAYGLMPPAYGALADRFGRVRVMRGALAGVAVADTISALSPNLTVLLVARFLTGGLACGVFPTALVYLGDRFPFAIRQQAVADLLVWVAIGTAAGTLGGGLVAHLWSWRVFFLIPAILAGMLAVALRDLPESLPARRPVNPFAQAVQVVTRPWALLLFGLAILEGAAMLGFITYLAPALEAHGQSAAVAGLVVAVYGVAVLAGTRAFRPVARRLPAPQILAGGAALLLAGFILVSLEQDVVTVLAASALAGGAYAFMHSTFQTWATDIVPEARGTAAGLFAMAVFTGAALATSTMAGYAGAHRFDLVFRVAAAVVVPVLVIGAIARWRYPQSGSPVAL
ncbi:MAG TPA: MFS transporter [Candidatus Limnocylindrales bacterium]|nr:MFS transporter [Candidatus Limnocylindrales bacterium]